MEDMLSQVDREVLVALLLLGDNSTGNLSDICDRHPNSIRDSFGRLEDEDFVVSKGSGVYALTFQGVTAARSVVRGSSVDIDTKQEWIRKLSQFDLI